MYAVQVWDGTELIGVTLYDDLGLDFETHEEAERWVQSTDAKFPFGNYAYSIFRRPDC